MNRDISDLPADCRKFELATCFEVLEHTYEPLKLIETLSRFAQNILISTFVVPQHEIASSEDWWYIAPEIGQHVTFYTLKSLKILADRIGLNLYSNGQNLHLFTSRSFLRNPLIKRHTIIDHFAGKLRFFWPSKKELPSLVPRNLETARKKAFQHYE